MASVKIENDLYVGMNIPFYPECPYAGHTVSDGEPQCTHPKGKYCCSIHHLPRNKGTSSECPFDIHKELSL